MAKKQQPTTDPTLAALDAAMEAAAQKPRAYLGMSQIGSACDRALWYSFRWAQKPAHSAATLRRFQDGFASEDITAARLRMVPGIHLQTHDENGNQFGFVSYGGHFSGHMDGVVYGLAQLPGAYAVWEHKCTNEDKFAKLGKLKEKHGEHGALKEWDETYYGQAQCYLAYTGLEHHYMTISTPGSREYTSVHTLADPDHAAQLKARALRIIEAQQPPAKLSDDPAFFVCKFCDFHDVCHGNKLAAVNCRTCLHSTPLVDDTAEAKWHCALADACIPPEEAAKAMPCHRYIPALLTWAQQIDATDDGDVIYAFPDGRQFTNGEGISLPGDSKSYLSVELAEANPDLIGIQDVEDMRRLADAEIVADTATLFDEDVPF